ncbi:hypothetical protein FALBO_6919 [Fusarium albosuccineum]|uniref:Uncharacterized protein n=1 Tax=Fusarium albosuccineum TaxID=1237068 RepID=A0A8H4LEV3_9HYPO|nr:hypothetical protein FALBO_6919 [Fusarium albosuccineum]
MAPPTSDLLQQSMPTSQNISNVTMAFPTSGPLHVGLERRHLSPEAVIGIVCGVCGVLVPIGIVLAKYIHKRCKCQRGADPENIIALNG